MRASAPLCLAVAVAGCGWRKAGNDGPTVEVSHDVATVAIVRWESPGADRAWVEFGPDGSYQTRAPAVLSDDGVFEAVLLGSKPDSAIDARVVEERDGEEAVTSEFAFKTGPVPNDLSTLEVEGDPSPVGGYITTGVFGLHANGVAIVDRDGDYVWWKLHAERLMAAHLRMSVDGQSVLYNEVNAADPSKASIYRASLDGTSLEAIPTPLSHHDFAELPDGTVAYIAYDEREVSPGNLVQGDVIVEVAPDGTSTEVFNIWDHLQYDPEVVLEEGTTWTHANALDYDAADDAWLIGFRQLDAIWKIDRQTGDPLWVLGGLDSDWTFVGNDPADRFSHQHQFEFTENDTLLVFDNGLETRGYSRVLEFAVDEDALEATLLSVYMLDPPQFNYVLGDVHRLPEGHTLVTWSTLGQSDEIDANGELLWRANIGIGNGMAYTEWFDSFYAED